MTCASRGPSFPAVPSPQGYGCVTSDRAHSWCSVPLCSMSSDTAGSLACRCERQPCADVGPASEGRAGQQDRVRTCCGRLPCKSVRFTDGGESLNGSPCGRKSTDLCPSAGGLCRWFWEEFTAPVSKESEKMWCILFELN